ncbi:hypothetical protein [Jidongwangia harbinensis]|uniref:hypothetical protein n=1 Tax=Jidongwangia harbinensis TaxID=2878561 RepID=UPI001CDA25BE|nr:hypothetical protein [Jidongwangia harbinensis]MCA2216285.1 hypothetical protein [Jidongwangia harbinensis]MCA2217020.1 hypothetical protein [Jidongwangia harbinensis]
MNDDELTDPITEIAEQVADCFSERGYAFVEDDHIEALAETLKCFLKTAGIPVQVHAMEKVIVPEVPPHLAGYSDRRSR